MVGDTMTPTPDLCTQLRAQLRDALIAQVTADGNLFRLQQSILSNELKLLDLNPGSPAWVALVQTIQQQQGQLPTLQQADIEAQTWVQEIQQQLTAAGCGKGGGS